MTNFFASRLFRRHFISYTFFIIVVIGLLLLILSIRTRVEEVNLQRNFTGLYRDQLQQALDEWISGQLKLTRYFAATLAGQEREELASLKTNLRIKDFLSVFTEAVDLLVVDGSGLVINARSPQAPQSRVNVADREYFREARESGTGMTGFFTGRNKGVLVMTVSSRFEDNRGEVYVAALFIRLDAFAKIIETIGGAGLGTAVLVGADGTQLLPPTPPDASVGILDDKTVRRVIDGGAGTLHLCLPDGSEGLGAYVWLPNLNAGLIVRLDESDLMFLTAGLWKSVPWIGLGALMLAIFLSYLLTLRAYRPIYALIKAVDNMAASDYEQAVDVAADDELRVLVDSFNRMRLMVAHRENRLADAARKDSLTGLLNHAALLEILAEVLKDTSRSGEAASFVMVDIDHFKRVNDTYGHPAGDYVLRRVAEILLGNVRSRDMVGRYGGEEFGIILRGQGKKGVYCERLRQAVENAVLEFEGHRIQVTVSIGWSCLGDKTGLTPEERLQTVVAAADDALYRAKKGGRNRVEAG